MTDMRSRTAMYAISGDPITNGHVFVLERAVELFDRVILTLAVNPDKRYTFSLEERKGMADRIVELFSRQWASPQHRAYDRISVAPLGPTEITVKAARRAGAGYLVRGVRDTKDFEYELRMAQFNSQLEPYVQTIFIPTPPYLSVVSSSFVKSLVGLEDWERTVEQYVPLPVLKKLAEWHASKGQS